MKDYFNSALAEQNNILRLVESKSDNFSKSEKSKVHTEYLFKKIYDFPDISKITNLSQIRDVIDKYFGHEAVSNGTLEVIWLYIHENMGAEHVTLYNIDRIIACQLSEGGFLYHLIDGIENDMSLAKDLYNDTLLNEHTQNKSTLKLIHSAIREYYSRDLDINDPDPFPADAEFDKFFSAKYEEFVKKQEDIDSAIKLGDYELAASISANEHPITLGLDSYYDFLKDNTPKSIKEELDKYIIGQDEAKRECAKYLYYHVLRLVKPDIPAHALLIMGPTGSGKTEIWRIIQKIYNIIPIEFIDGSSLSKSGWRGSNKLECHLDYAVLKSGIVIVDEFDKTCTPEYSGGGDNVSYSIQNEFLKLMEGEYTNFIRDEVGMEKKLVSQGVEVVLIGAFEEIYKTKKDDKRMSFGFSNENRDNSIDIKLEDIIEFGMRPEIAGRITTICETQELDLEDYVQIIKNPNSRIARMCTALGVNIEKYSNLAMITELVNESKKNQTGVRWVLNHLENKMMNDFYDNGVVV